MGYSPKVFSSLFFLIAKLTIIIYNNFLHIKQFLLLYQSYMLPLASNKTQTQDEHLQQVSLDLNQSAHVQISSVISFDFKEAIEHSQLKENLTDKSKDETKEGPTSYINSGYCQITPENDLSLKQRQMHSTENLVVEQECQNLIKEEQYLRQQYAESTKRQEAFRQQNQQLIDRENQYRSTFPERNSSQSFYLGFQLQSSKRILEYQINIKESKIKNIHYNTQMQQSSLRQIMLIKLNQQIQINNSLLKHRDLYLIKIKLLQNRIQALNIARQIQINQRLKIIENLSKKQLASQQMVIILSATIKQGSVINDCKKQSSCSKNAEKTSTSRYQQSMNQRLTIKNKNKRKYSD